MSKIENPVAFPGLSEDDDYVSVKTLKLETGETVQYIKHEKGMTLLDYFAARAPEGIPNFFEPVVPEPPKVRDYSFNYFGISGNHPNRKLFVEFYSSQNKSFVDTEGEVPEEFKKEVSEYQKARDAEEQEYKKWLAEKETLRLVQWRYYYAKKMLETRSKIINET